MDIKPIIKVYEGDSSILCNYCSAIIRSNLTKEEVRDLSPRLLFCNFNCSLSYRRLNNLKLE